MVLEKELFLVESQTEWLVCLLNVLSAFAIWYEIGCCHGVMEGDEVPLEIMQRITCLVTITWKDNAKPRIKLVPVTKIGTRKPSLNGLHLDTPIRKDRGLWVGGFLGLCVVFSCFCKRKWDLVVSLAAASRKMRPMGLSLFWLLYHHTCVVTERLCAVVLPQILL